MTPTNDIKLNFRSVQPTDLGYLIKTLMKMARQMEHNSFIDNDDYSVHFKYRLVSFLGASNTFTILATLPSEPTEILGFLVYGFTKKEKHLAVHYIYVRGKNDGSNGARQLGIARRLIDAVYDSTKPIVATRYARLLPSFLNKYNNLTYDPYVVLDDKKEQ